MAGFNLELKDDNSDYPALMLGNYMFGGGFLNSRLATRIRQKEGISYGVGSWVSADDMDKTGSFGSYAIYNPENSDKLIACYKEELQKMLSAGFTQDELNDARKGVLQHRKLGRANDNALVYRLSRNLYIGRTMQFSKQIDDNISALSLEQVNAAMKKWIKPDKISYIQAGDFGKAGKLNKRVTVNIRPRGLIRITINSVCLVYEGTFNHYPRVSGFHCFCPAGFFKS